MEQSQNSPDDGDHAIVIGCMNCGLPLVPNHHPDAGKPEHINTVGCPSGCLPCTEKRANGRHKVIVGLRMWIEDEISGLENGGEQYWQHRPNDKPRLAVLQEVLAKLNDMEEARRVAYHASR